MSSPAIYGGSRTKILTSKGLLLKDGTPIDFNGPKNYITKGTFPTNAITGWSLKRTTLDANKVPNQVAASWTNPSVLTLTATSTGALTNSGFSLSLAASAATTAGDMLVSDAYTIDKEDQAKVLNFKFSYQAYANASNLNFSGTSSNTFHVYIYDATSGQEAWIQPTGCYTMVQNSGVGIGYGTFQTPANMTQFRIAIVSCNASSGAFTLYTDNFFVGPQQFNMGPPVTDPVSYTPIWSNTTTNPSLGNGTLTANWSRVGKFMQGEIVLLIGSTTTFGTGSVWGFSLPSFATVDANVINKVETAVGVWAAVDSGITRYDGIVRLDGTSNTLYLMSRVQATYPTSNTPLNSSVPFTASSGDVYTISFKVPIAGWSSNTVMSSDAATNVVAFKGYNSGGSIANGGTPVVVPLSTATVNQGGFTFTSGASANVVVPTSGIYKISVTIGYTAAATGTQIVGYKINSGSFVGIGVRGAPPIYDSTVGNDTLSLNAGDVIYMMAVNNNTTALTIDGARMLLERISGPAQIAASETVAAKYAATTAFSLGNDVATKIDFNSKVYDSHNAVTTGASWKFTAPISGIYEVSSAIIINAARSATEVFAFDISVYKISGGTDVLDTKMNRLDTFGTGNAFPGISGTTKLKLLAGESVYIAGKQSSGSSRNLTANGAENWVTIDRIGNY